MREARTTELRKEEAHCPALPAACLGLCTSTLNSRPTQPARRPPARRSGGSRTRRAATSHRTARSLAIAASGWLGVGGAGRPPSLAVSAERRASGQPSRSATLCRKYLSLTPRTRRARCLRALRPWPARADRLVRAYRDQQTTEGLEERLAMLQEEPHRTVATHAEGHCSCTGTHASTGADANARCGEAGSGRQRRRQRFAPAPAATASEPPAIQSANAAAPMSDRQARAARLLASRGAAMAPTNKLGSERHCWVGPLPSGILPGARAKRPVKGRPDPCRRPAGWSDGAPVDAAILSAAAPSAVQGGGLDNVLGASRDRDQQQVWLTALPCERSADKTQARPSWRAWKNSWQSCVQKTCGYVRKTQRRLSS